MNSEVWKDFEFHKGDVIYGSYMKSGTTLLGKIIEEILLDNKVMIPFIELRVVNQNKVKEKVKKHQARRVIKTHAPSDVIPICKDASFAKYVQIIRDFRDIMMSAYDKYKYNTKKITFEILNKDSTGKITSDFKQPSGSFENFFEEKLLLEGLIPNWNYWNTLITWFTTEKELDNVLIIHYADFLTQPKEEIKKVAEFLEVKLSDKRLKEIVKATSFKNMKDHADTLTPDPQLWKDPKKFFNKGTNGRWKSYLSKELSQQYERIAKEKLGEELSSWVNR